jgi:hypothetical protein
MELEATKSDQEEADLGKGVTHDDVQHSSMLEAHV